jgi:hypothetical protein
MTDLPIRIEFKNTEGPENTEGPAQKATREPLT